jgi:nucleoside-diphosphate-sugar epimerase
MTELQPHIFITGIGSFIGQAVVRLCESRGIVYSGIDTIAVDLNGAQVCDIRSPDVADFMPKNIDAVVHLAALSRDPDCKGKMFETLDVNVAGTLNIADSALKRGVSQFIFASTEWVYDSFDANVEKTEASPINAENLNSEYALSKYIAENALRLALAGTATALTNLRFGIVYGPRLNNWSAVEAVMNLVATRDDVTVGAKVTGRRFIYVDDIASGILASLGLPGQLALNVQGPRLVTLGEVIDVSAKLLGRSPKINEGDPQNPSIRQVSALAMTDQTGWTAQIELEQGLAEVIALLRLHGKLPA